MLANHKAYHESLKVAAPSSRIPFAFQNSTPFSMRLTAYSAPVLVLLLGAVFYGIEEAFFGALLYPAIRCMLWILGMWKKVIFGKRV